LLAGKGSSRTSKKRSAVRAETIALI
jgi:hypothetical protein